MANQVLPITGLDTIGLIEDVPPVALPPSAFSDCRNVRFRDGAVQKMQGDVNILPYINVDETDTLRYVAWWPNPNLSFASLGYYLLIYQQNIDTGLKDVAYLVKADELGRYSSPTAAEDLRLSLAKYDSDGAISANYKGEFNPGGNWQHTFFQGGFSLIINNGLEAPRFVLDSDDNVETANIPAFAVLPNWQSYAADPLYQTLIEMEDDEMIDASTLQVTAGVIRDFGDFLVAGNLVERANVIDPSTMEIIRSNAVIRALPGIVRSSDIAAPGQIPANWNPFATAVNTADEFTITNDGIVQDFVELQGNMFIYSNSSISVMARTGNATVPLSVRPVTTSYGALTTDSVIEYDGRHFVVGAQDIYIFGGHPGSIQSVGDSKVRDTFYNNLNPLSIDNTFILRYQQKDEIWICYANKDSLSGLVNEAYIWNYRKNNWTKRDLQNVVAGDIAPIPGGGLPLAELLFEGTSGNDNVMDAGAVHKNHFSTNGDLLYGSSTTNQIGQIHKYEVIIKADMPVVTENELGTPVHFITFGNDFDSGTTGELNFATQGRTFVAADNQGRFLQVPNYDGTIGNDRDGVVAGTYNGTFRDLNFRVGLAQDINSDAAVSVQQFATDVTLPVFLDLLRKDPDNFTWPRLADALDPDISTVPQYIKDFFIAANNEEAIPAFDENAPITLHFTDAFDTFVIQYEVIPGEVLPYSSFVQIGKDISFFEESQLIRGATEIANDQIGHLISEDAEAAKEVDSVAGPANTFYFDFEDVTDTAELENLVFFFKGAADSSTATGYAELPTNAVIFRPDNFLGEGDTDMVDGGVADETAGDAMDGGAVGGAQSDGERTTELVFDMNLIQDEPIAGTDIITRIGAGDEFAWQAWVPDGTTPVTDLVLVAYQRPVESDGIVEVDTSQSAQRNFVVDDIPPALLTNLPPIVTFSGMQQEYQDDTSTSNDFGWRKGILVDPNYPNLSLYDFDVALAYDSGAADTGTINPEDPYAATQRAAFADAIFNSFFNNPGIPLHSVTNTLIDGNWVITVETYRNIGVSLSIVVENPDSTNSGDAITFGTDDSNHIQVKQTQQGIYDYYFESDGAGGFVTDDLTSLTINNDVRRLVPPHIRFLYEDPDGIEFFNFAIELHLITDGATYTQADYQQQIVDAINNSGEFPNGNPWVHEAGSDATTFSINTNPIEYDQFGHLEGNTVGDSGVDNPDPYTFSPYLYTYGYVNFPAERNGQAFGTFHHTTGSGFAGELNNFFDIEPTTTDQGAYPDSSVPSYVILRTSDRTVTTVPPEGPGVAGEEVLLFEVPNGLSARDTVNNLRTQIERRAPRLRAVVSGSGRLSIQPANYNDLAEFVTEFRINNETDINRIRLLLDANKYNQDEFNPKPLTNLPERIQFGRNGNNEEVDNGRGYINVSTDGDLTLDRTIEPTREFDVLRPWPRTQVNFTLEFPIFAATRLFEDGTTTNKVLAADIGFARPAFERPNTRRIEFTDGSQTSIVFPIVDGDGNMVPAIRTNTDEILSDSGSQVLIGNVPYGQDAPTDYESFVERKQQGLSPEFDTETLSSVAMWTDGRTQSRFQDTTFLYNFLQLNVTPSDSPGHIVDLSSDATLQNIQFISEDYKVDTRITGRFVNWRISDQVESTDHPVADNKLFSHQSEWNLSGLQFSVGQAGRR